MSETTTSWITAIFFALGVFFPGLIVSGFMPELDVLPLAAWVLISGVSAAIGCAAAATHNRPIAAALGFIGGVGSLAAIPAYVWLRSGISSTYWSIEFILPVGLVAFPLTLIWGAFSPPSDAVAAPEGQPEEVPPKEVFDPPGEGS